MPAILLYLVKFSCSLGLIWLFYRLVLHSLTFYTLNRWYLLSYTLLSSLMPLVNIGPIRGEDPALQPVIIQYIPVIDNPIPSTTAIAVASRTTHWDVWSCLLLLLALGSSFLLVRFLVRCYSLHNLRRRATLLQEGPINIFQVQEPVSPFSFGNAIYVNTGEHSEKEWEEIILHEYVHIRERHTIDILFGELLVIINWYNPFAWLIRYSIRQNLEFIADRAVINNGFDKKGYQYHLLKVVGQTRYKLANNFNFSSLKKRIIMMNKLRSAKLHLIRFLFILPLLAVLLVAFRDRLPAFHSRQDLFVNAAGLVISMPGRKPIAGATVKELVTGLQTTTDNRGFYKLRIPVKKDSVHFSIEYSKAGYMGSRTDQSWPSLKQSKGWCDIGFMQLESNPENGIYSLASPREQPPVDPAYEDALRELKTVQRFDVVERVRQSMQKAHPEIGLWYFTAGTQRSILVHTDGTVERYGYPGTPPFTDMGNKYGPEYFLMVGNLPPVSSTYLSRWAAISARAEKDFHTSSSNVKAILFPGDSRVIAVPVSGKPRVYDMDSDDPKERPAFEQLYGRLPACVPAPAHYPASAITPPATIASPVILVPTPTLTPSPADTIPHSRDTAHRFPVVIHAAAPLKDIPIDKDKVLWVVDGATKPSGWDWRDSLKDVHIASEVLVTDEQATRIFGKAGANGVLAIHTASVQNTIFQISQLTRAGRNTRFILDGREVSFSALDSLGPDSIQSISTTQDKATEKGNGEYNHEMVISITTKKAAANTPK